MSRIVRAARDRAKITKTVGRFLAHCSIIRGCRGYIRSRRGGPLALVLIMPEGGDAESYEQATIFAFAQHARADRFGRADIATIAIAADRWTKRKKDSTNDEILKEDRFIVLARNAAEVPEMVLAAVDGVVTLAGPEPRHLVAAGWICLKQRMSMQQGKELAAMPLALIGAMLRRGRPIAQSFESMRKALAARMPVETRQLLIEDLHGLGEAGDWARELAIDFKDWREGRIGWVDVDRGILVSGPTGTGKTTFVKALASTCGVHLVLGSLARWQARGHLGDLLNAMRAAFDEARRNAPSIIFIDEIDAVGDREKFAGHNAQYCMEVVAGLLECIDGAEQREGVVVVGACNYPDRLDSALVRPGRLDRHIRIRLPDGAAREGILRWHLAGALQENCLSAVVDRTEGWSGAALEQLVRQARRTARRARRAITIADFKASLPPTIAIPEHMMRRAAIHEAGHVIAAVALGKPIEFAEIQDLATMANGHQELGSVRIGNTPFAEITAQNLLDEICFLLSGLAAEEVILGSRSTSGGGLSGSDLHLATLAALRLEASYGLGEMLTFLAADNETDLFASLKESQVVREHVELLLSAQIDRARALIAEHREFVEQIVTGLLTQKRISAVELSEMRPQRAKREAR